MEYKSWQSWSNIILSDPRYSVRHARVHLFSFPENQRLLFALAASIRKWDSECPEYFVCGLCVLVCSQQPTCNGGAQCIECCENCALVKAGHENCYAPNSYFARYRDAGDYERKALRKEIRDKLIEAYDQEMKRVMREHQDKTESEKA
jgi:hypothetical protein